MLDPFAGTGTTLRVALEMGRDSFGTDLNPIIPEDLVSQISIVE